MDYERRNCDLDTGVPSQSVRSGYSALTCEQCSARVVTVAFFKAFAVRINEPVAYALLYASMYAAFGVASPFWPKFFETRSLASQQIGFMLGAAMLVRLLAGPAVGRLADVSKSWRLVLAICAALAAVMAVALLLANTFWLLFLVASLQAAALAPTTSIADALSVNAAKPQIAGKPFEYGWIRGAASAAFVLGTLIMGQLVSRSDFNPIIWLNAALLLATAAATALLPKPNTESERNTSPSAGVDSVRGLLRISGFRMLILVSALVFGSHAMHDAFAFIRWSDAGMDAPVISILWSEAVAAEVIVFLVIGPALRRWAFVGLAPAEYRLCGMISSELRADRPVTILFFHIGAHGGL